MTDNSADSEPQGEPLEGEPPEGEPLEGDIGPASAAPRVSLTREAVGPESGDSANGRAEALRRYEAEREERRRRANAASGRIALALAAALLAFLFYDSVRTAVQAHSRGGDWVYPPAVIAGVCGAALAALVVGAVRRRR
ncbi:hypothetical protein [Actinomadura macra]|uniref:hypothetical protein n=1 Tax=Actinomadura macra TaxID=46164 RepID=UPI0008343C63|nr:hypothetical protein [Actinomadura macra]